jgi:hypothetical protein
MRRAPRSDRRSDRRAARHGAVNEQKVPNLHRREHSQNGGIGKHSLDDGSLREHDLSARRELGTDDVQRNRDLLEAVSRASGVPSQPRSPRGSAI